MSRLICSAFLALLLTACGSENVDEPAATDSGERLIPVTTAFGTYNVWTKKTGDNPTAKVLLLHGGPAATSEYFEVLDSYFDGAGVEYYHYDQLGSARSDQPDNDSLWTIDRFVDEVEQVRQALGLGPDNFFLLGHSWGGILAMEYALKYQENLKGLVISNMMSSAMDYDAYANEVLGPMLDPDVLAEIMALEAAEDFANPRYEELLMAHFYPEHVLRAPPEEWPDAVLRAFGKMNSHIYVLMQGPSEFGIAGSLETWDRSADLGRISVPTLVIGAGHDTMDPAHMEWMASEVQNGRYLLCPDGSHMAMWDDEEVYAGGLLSFIGDVAGE
ncbi:MAG: proline iminopeptidase [Rhodothermales bacterium]|jgi:proline iminopeptidase